MKKIDEIANIASALSSQSVMSKSRFDYARHNLTIDNQVMAMILLFPQILLYRGGVFLKDRFDKSTCDQWFSSYADQISLIEKAVNFINLSDYVLEDDNSHFSLCDLVEFFRLSWATWIPQAAGRPINVQAVCENGVASITFHSSAV